LLSLVFTTQRQTEDYDDADCDNDVNHDDNNTNDCKN